MIEEIMSLDTSADIQLLEAQVKIVKAKESYWKAVKPMRKNITLDMIKEEQNYQPIDEKTFFDKAAKVEVKESVDELLGMLTR